MRARPLLLLAVVALAGCPPPGALVLLDAPQEAAPCERPPQYGYLRPIAPDSLNAFLGGPRVGGPIRLFLRDGGEVEAVAPRVARDTLFYTPPHGAGGAATPLREVSRLAVPVATYGPGDVIAFVLRGRYEDVAVLVGCDR